MKYTNTKKKIEITEMILKLMYFKDPPTNDMTRFPGWTRDSLAHALSGVHSKNKNAFIEWHLKMLMKADPMGLSSIGITTTYIRRSVFGKYRWNVTDRELLKHFIENDMTVAKAERKTKTNKTNKTNKSVVVAPVDSNVPHTFTVAFPLNDHYSCERDNMTNLFAITNTESKIAITEYKYSLNDLLTGGEKLIKIVLFSNI